MSVQGFLARRGVLELSIQSNVYGSLYVVFAEGGVLEYPEHPPVSAPVTTQPRVHTVQVAKCS